MMHLSHEQETALRHIASWYESTAPGARGFGFAPAPFRLFGPAGTGKTTLAREVPTALGLREGARYAAYTGKAASVLRGKGCTPASTLHSLIYLPTSSAEARMRLASAQEELAEAQAALLGQPSEADTINERIDQLRAEIQELEREVRRVSWEWNPSSPLATAPLLVLDEVSMVDAKLAADIERFEVPVLVLGDPEQLEPVGGEGYYTDAAPDFALTEIHRQALESPVLSLANRIRTSTDAKLGMTEKDMEPVSLAQAMEHEQILVWSNKKRWNILNAIRLRQGRTPGVPGPGDRIMCLTNNKDLAVFNGQQFTVLQATPGTLGPTLTVMTDAGVEQTMPCYADGFQGREQQDAAKAASAGARGGRMLATFAQAITVHKAQGSEWSSVYVVNETPAMISMGVRRVGMSEAVQSARRWLYTAVTRASDRVTITVPR